MAKDKKRGGFGKFLFGAAIGATLGVMLAPRDGKKTREQFKKKLDELLLKLNEVDFEEVKDDFETKIEEIKLELEDLDKEKALNIAKEQSERIITKADALVKDAVDASKPHIEKLTRELRVHAINITKDVLNRLEEEA